MYNCDICDWWIENYLYSDWLNTRKSLLQHTIFLVMEIRTDRQADRHLKSKSCFATNKGLSDIHLYWESPQQISTVYMY